MHVRSSSSFKVVVAVVVVAVVVVAVVVVESKTSATSCCFSYKFVEDKRKERKLHSRHKITIKKNAKDRVQGRTSARELLKKHASRLPTCKYPNLFQVS